jgi:hypothetical protein
MKAVEAALFSYHASVKDDPSKRQVRLYLCLCPLPCCGCSVPVPIVSVRAYVCTGTRLHQRPHASDSPLMLTPNPEPSALDPCPNPQSEPLITPDYEP